MDTLQSSKILQSDIKSTVNDENEVRRKYQNRKSPSPLHDRFSVSPQQSINSDIHSTPIRKNCLEDIQEEENGDTVHSVHHPSMCSTFALLPSHTTPPPRQNIIRNPFDAVLLKRLHLPIYSPNVFKKVVSPSQVRYNFIEQIK
jgi:hypothetical protein